MSIFISVLGAAYMVCGLVSWLATAVESIGELPPGSYEARLKDFSKEGSLYEFIVSLYVFLFWPIHLTTKKLTRQ